MGTLNEDLTAIKAVEDKLTANQVAKFAYTQHAYDNPLTEADGVTTFNPENPQNIPLGRADILKVNPSVLQYGWRAQASAITRMLMNHFLGRVSYNLNKINDNMSSLLTTVLSHLGTANGIATLDADGRIPYSQLPESAMELKGYWNASTNTPTLADGTGTSGDFYFVEVAGTRDLGSGEQYFGVGDRVLYDGSIWKNISSGNVKTINSRAPTATGNIDLTKSDVGLSNVDNTGDSNMPVENGTTKFTTGGAHNMLTSLAPAFDSAVSYSQGTIVSYQGRLYRCTTAHQGAWDANDFAIANLNEGVGTSNVTGVKGEAESSYRSGNVNITMDNLIKGFKTIAGVAFLNLLGDKWKVMDAPNNISPSYAKYYNGLWLCPSRAEETLYCSEDAEHWTKVSESELIPIMYENGLYIAYLSASTPSLWWSENGRDWHQGTIIGDAPVCSYYPDIEDKLSLYDSTLGIYEICADNGIFYSEDGKTWQQGTFIGETIPLNLRLNSIVASDTIMIAGDGSHSRVWWSEEGKVWTAVTLTQYDTFSVLQGGVYYGNGEYFCCLYGQGLWSSTNGKTWNKVFTSTPYDTASVRLLYIEETKFWIACLEDSTNNRLHISQHFFGSGWASVMSNASIYNSGANVQQIALNKYSIGGTTATTTYASHVVSMKAVAPDTVIIVTDLAVLKLVLYSSTTQNFYTTNFYEYNSIPPYKTGIDNQPSIGYRPLYCIAWDMNLVRLASGINNQYYVSSYKNLVILSPVNSSQGLLVSHDYGRNWKKITFGALTLTNGVKYGGGSLLINGLSEPLDSTTTKLVISNFDTIKDCIKEDKDYPTSA